MNRPVEETKSRLPINKDKFTKITPESAYWLGFLLADGCVTTSENKGDRIQLKLGSVDKEHLQKFKNFLECGHKIGYNPNDGCNYLMVTSNYISYDLRQYGIVPNKAKTVKVDPKLRPNKHFWRGAIDGDGYINKKETEMGLAGSKNTLECFANFCGKFIGNTPTIKDYDDTFTTRLSANKTIKLIKFIYDDYSPALKRKKNLALSKLN